MQFGIGTYGLAYAAGLLSTLSPCVLPLLPLLLASAASAHRWGVAALTAGLALSFAVTGTLLAALGTSLGIDELMLRNASAVLLVAAGVVTLLPALQRRFGSAASGIAAIGHTYSAESIRSACAANSSSACCSARSGVPAQVRRSAQRSHSRCKARRWAPSQRS